MPKEEELPDDLKDLTQRHALFVNYNNFDHDISKLDKIIEQILSEAIVPRPLPHQNRFLALDSLHSVSHKAMERDN